MAFAIFMWVVDLLLPATMLAFGWAWKTRPPRERNGGFGYRTRRSRSSQAAWDYAQALCARLWRVLGGVLAAGVVLCKLFIEQEPAQLSIAMLICTGAGILLPIPVVERKLKQEFGD